MIRSAKESHPAETALVRWDQERIKDLLCAPNRLLREEPWSGWIQQCGGLPGVYEQLRELPLPEHQSQLLRLLVEQPRLPVKCYAARLNIDRATFFRHRSALINTLARHFNSGMQAATPRPAPVTRARATPLPARAGAFIGRAQEQAGLCTLLRQGQPRLLTILGPGGCGKSQLALQVAHELQAQDGHEVVWVPLAGVRTPIDLLRALGKALELEDNPAKALLDQICAFLQTRHCLLVLDNVEQLREAGPLLASLLDAAPAVKLVTTSRAPLHLRVEAIFSLAPLATPPLAALPGYDELANSPAIRLFVERAREVAPHFELSPTNAVAVAQVCALGDGLPLTIELAASRMRYLSPQALLAGMRSRLDMFDGGPRDLPARQRGLRQLYNWSYALLSAEAQTLFRQLAIFAEGWTLEAAEQVCRSQQGARHELLNALMLLLDQSLIQRQSQGDGAEDRYIMLETVREYALERLEACDELAQLRQRHAAYFRGLVALAEAGLRGRDGQHWAGLLRREAANLAAMRRWAHEHGEALLLPEHELTQVAVQLPYALQLPRGSHGVLREPLQAVAPSSALLC